MPAMFWAVIELSWGAAEEGNPPGVLVLLLFVGAAMCIVLGHFTIPAAVRRRTIQTGTVLDGPSANGMTGRRGHRRPSSADKRKHTRRGGDPRPVWLAVSPDGALAKNATVLDRSRGGLLLAVDESFDVGSVRYVRPCNADEDLEWIRLEVRHCRQRDGRWFLGCKFSNELPWGIILMFG
jgi:hypothetical protein